MVRDLEARLPLARLYEAETARLRNKAGAPAALLRVKAASDAVKTASSEIGRADAFTVRGIAIKAEALKSDIEALGLHGLSGFIGDSYRLANNLVAIAGADLGHEDNAPEVKQPPKAA